MKKKELAEKFGLISYYAKGYTDSYLGVKTAKVKKENIAQLVQLTLDAMVAAQESVSP
ncbi:hypothetical protein [Rothia sp. ZJ932]|uniref:hypothetical protein n=1 Tax=Rothia sp. ZJ932 TaxID=2810516 RepID=UPI00196891D7|nr:hypothetical protein [Rothia sp. ZJ932]QRZ61648.1 hypothetical protein JR346_00395 [Rothia sp. ZJ932]